MSVLAVGQGRMYVFTGCYAGESKCLYWLLYRGE